MLEADDEDMWTNNGNILSLLNKLIMFQQILPLMSTVVMNDNMAELMWKQGWMIIGMNDNWVGIEVNGVPRKRMRLEKGN